MKRKKEAHCRLQEQQTPQEGGTDGIKPLKENYYSCLITELAAEI